MFTSGHPMASQLYSMTQSKDIFCSNGSTFTIFAES